MRLFPPAEFANVAYSPGSQLGPGSAGATLGDLDGDNHAEVVLQWESASRTWLEVLHNDGGFQFHDVTAASFGAYETTLDGGGLAQSQYLRDVDGDGELDLVLGYISWASTDMTNRNFVFVGDGRGGFAPWRFTHGGRAASSTELDAVFPSGWQDYEKQGIPLLVDVNHDGVLDVVLVSELVSVASPRQTQTI